MKSLGKNMEDIKAELLAYIKENNNKTYNSYKKPLKFYLTWYTDPELMELSFVLVENADINIIKKLCVDDRRAQPIYKTSFLNIEGKFLDGCWLSDNPGPTLGYIRVDKDFDGCRYTSLNDVGYKTPEELISITNKNNDL